MGSAETGGVERRAATGSYKRGDSEVPQEENTKFLGGDIEGSNTDSRVLEGNIEVT